MHSPNGQRNSASFFTLLPVEHSGETTSGIEHTARNYVTDVFQRIFGRCMGSEKNKPLLEKDKFFWDENGNAIMVYEDCIQQKYRRFC